MEKNIVLTGGTGFIGSHLTENLLKKNKNVLLFKRSFSNINNILNLQKKFSNLKLINIDLINIPEIFETYNIEGVIHLAAYAQRSHNYEGISQMIDSNIKFPSKLLENIVNSSAKYFINTGSFSEYDLNKSPISEQTKIKPFNFYASTKISFENILKFYHNQYDLNCLTLKLFTPYGPKDDEKKITPYLIINALKQNKIIIKSSQKELDFIYIDDIINAYEKALIKINRFKKYESFNIGTGTPHSIPDVLNYIEKILNIETEKELFELENDKVWCSNYKAFKYLNWKPTTNLKQGLQLTIDYYKNKYKINTNNLGNKYD